MKGILTLIFTSLLLSSYSFANQPNMDRGTAAVDEKYEDEIKTRDSAIEKQPPGATNTQVYGQEDDQDRGALKEMDKRVEKGQE